MNRLLRGICRRLLARRRVLEMLRGRWTPSTELGRTLTFEGPFDVELFGQRIRLRNGGFPMEQDLFWRGEAGLRHPRTLELWMELAAGSRCIVDVGASTGIYTLAARAVNRSAEIVAVEPIPRIFDRLLANVELNGARVHCFDGAASNREGPVTLDDPPVEEGGATPAMVPDGGEGKVLSLRRVLVPGLRLDRVVESLRLPAPDLVKIHVDGHEPQVLEGMGYLLESRPTVLLEVAGVDAAQRITSVVRGLGYLAYSIHPQEGLLPLGSLESAPVRNILLCQEADALEMDVQLPQRALVS
jgi:FkbM family methyltransferase